MQTDKHREKTGRPISGNLFSPFYGSVVPQSILGQYINTFFVLFCQEKNKYTSFGELVEKMMNFAMKKKKMGMVERGGNMLGGATWR